jgi:predicted nucleic acid-binding protein
MDFVVDTNVLFTFFWERSFTRKLLVKQELDLFSPEFALEEINSHCDEILKKTDISLEEFKKLRKELAILVEFIPLEEYSSFMEKASAIPWIAPSGLMTKN